jgi:hypothetical protein
MLCDRRILIFILNFYSYLILILFNYITHMTFLLIFALFYFACIVYIYLIVLHSIKRSYVVGPKLTTNQFHGTKILSIKITFFPPPSFHRFPLFFHRSPFSPFFPIFPISFHLIFPQTPPSFFDVFRYQGALLAALGAAGWITLGWAENPYPPFVPMWEKVLFWSICIRGLRRERKQDSGEDYGVSE